MSNSQQLFNATQNQHIITAEIMGLLY